MIGVPATPSSIDSALTLIKRMMDQRRAISRSLSCADGVCAVLKQQCRDSLLGGVYILAALASNYQLQGSGRIVFMPVLGGFFDWWCISRALWGPNNDIFNTQLPKSH